MLTVPVATVYFHKGSVGQQIDGAFKEVNVIAAQCRNAEREPLVASAGIANKIRPETSQVCIPGLVVLVQPDNTALW